MAFERRRLLATGSPSIAAAGSFTWDIPIPENVRVKRYGAVATATEAAHATQILAVTFTNKGTNGAGSTVLATLTNDSGQADSTVQKTGTWTANVAKEVNAESRPGSPTSAQNTADAVTAGSVIQVAVTKAAGTQTGFVTPYIEVVEST